MPLIYKQLDQKYWDYGLQFSGFAANSVILFFVSSEILGEFARTFLISEVIAGVCLVPIENVLIRGGIKAQRLFTKTLKFRFLFAFVLLLIPVTLNYNIYIFLISIFNAIIPRIALRQLKYFEKLFYANFIALLLFFIGFILFGADFIVELYLIRSILIVGGTLLMTKNALEYSRIDVKYDFSFHLFSGYKLAPELIINGMIIQNLGVIQIAAYKFIKDLSGYVKKFLSPIYLDVFSERESIEFLRWNKRMSIRLLGLFVIMSLFLCLFSLAKFNVNEIWLICLVILIVVKMWVKLLLDLAVLSSRNSRIDRKIPLLFIALLILTASYSGNRWGIHISLLFVVFSDLISQREVLKQMINAGSINSK